MSVTLKFILSDCGLISEQYSGHYPFPIDSEWSPPPPSRFFSWRIFVLYVVPWQSLSQPAEEGHGWNQKGHDWVPFFHACCDSPLCWGTGLTRAIGTDVHISSLVHRIPSGIGIYFQTKFLVFTTEKKSLKIKLKSQGDICQSLQRAYDNSPANTASAKTTVGSKWKGIQRSLLTHHKPVTAAATVCISWVGHYTTSRMALEKGRFPFPSWLQKRWG